MLFSEEHVIFLWSIFLSFQEITISWQAQEEQSWAVKLWWSSCPHSSDISPSPSLNTAGYNGKPDTTLERKHAHEVPVILGFTLLSLLQQLTLLLQHLTGCEITQEFLTFPCQGSSQFIDKGFVAAMSLCGNVVLGFFLFVLFCFLFVFSGGDVDKIVTFIVECWKPYRNPVIYFLNLHLEKKISSKHKFTGELYRQKRGRRRNDRFYIALFSILRDTLHEMHRQQQIQNT